jgi:flavin reductase (DIM6/NTAB) family NADH-FMN oxidoreductase RutF
MATERTTVAVSEESIRAFHRSFVTGVTIVTTRHKGELRGLVVNAFASISLTPPLIFVAVARQAATHDWIFGAGSFCVNVLSVAQAELARRFASPITDKFAGVPWHEGDHGLPVLDDSCATLEADVCERASAQTHTVFIGRIRSSTTRPLPPLVYAQGQFFDGSALSDPLR